MDDIQILEDNGYLEDIINECNLLYGNKINRILKEMFILQFR